MNRLPIKTQEVANSNAPIQIINMADLEQGVGIGAGMLTAVAQVPQLIKVVKKRKADDISYVMLLVLIAGLSGWLWYGILKSDLPLTATNGFSLAINLLLLAFSLRYKAKK